MGTYKKQFGKGNKGFNIIVKCGFKIGNFELENLIAIRDNISDSTSKSFMKKMKKALFLEVFELENSLTE